MRHSLKFLHSVGAIGLMGGIACLLVLHGFMPAPAALTEYARLRAAMGGIATWILFPSLALTLVAGLLAIAANPAFHNAGWAWAKLATGLLVFEWSFVAIIGPVQEEAELSARALANRADVLLGASLAAEQGSLWVMLAVATANVVLGVWRPRFTRRA
ncbi:MAG: hypothetical protein U1E60_16150 [Reyranellaceae bacterium]